MLTLLGSLLGFGTSFLPKVLDFFQDKQDKKHELNMMDKQLEAQKLLHSQKIDLAQVEADIREVEALHKEQAQTVARGPTWLAALSGSVRPIITYAFFGLFIFVEYSLYSALMEAGVSMGDAAKLVWTEEVQSLFAAVISFWFGNRTREKLDARK